MSLQITAQVASLVAPIAYTSPDASATFFLNPGDVELRVRNNAGVAKRVNFTTQNPDDMGIILDQEISIPAGQELRRRRVDTQRFNDDAGLVHMDFPDGVTSVGVAVIKG